MSRSYDDAMPRIMLPNARAASADVAASSHVVLSGCSGGGKSSLLSELERRGFPVISEPGRRIVNEELRGAGSALPWVNPTAFAMRAIDVAARDREYAPERTGWIFFDRGLVDAAIALQYASGQTAAVTLAPFARYHFQVFLTPPWPEIYVTDNERQHGLQDAIAEYRLLLRGYDDLGYNTIILPKIGIDERADFILRHLQ